MNHLASLLMLVCLVTTGVAEARKSTNETPLPEAAAGYRWERFTEMQGAFLCPTGWHRFHQQGTNTHTFVLSKESVDSNGMFETGLTVQTVKGLRVSKGMTPSAVAAQMGAGIVAQSENRELASQDLSSGPFSAFFIRYRNAPADKTPIVVHQVFISNDKKDTLFIVTFEAPEESWKEAWRLGEPMVQKFMIDDEY